MNPDTSGYNAPLCPDWVFLNNANVHVAKDRGWFKTYTPFTSTVNPSPLFNAQQRTPVLGIGTVEIPTKRSPNITGVSSHGSIVLREVLHVPDYICNVIGRPLLFTDGYNVTTSFGKKSLGTIKDSQGRNAAFFDPARPLFVIKVRCPPNGPTLGPHALKKDGNYMLGCEWDAIEKLKWEEFKASGGISTSGPNSASYTAEETAFLKKHYGSEFHFLTQHGLKIHAEKDREEGRAILRTLMREDDLSENEESDDESEFQGHQADYNFTDRQLDWIEKNYRNSEQFMISYGLKFYSEEDLQEAQAIVDALMNDDD
ncbi:hypothetical protein CFE70_001445 [Pyrenophora teres f. teres 0-1]|uniref:Retrovirus-related Pol polyprotein from transposon TNT 1-94-like beta-barrel domain-containing protein n=1 Tax=Pyrenophora teres f. teres (strain 0-1) TaxID=861557 RepID=E3RT80_PYRTT|nr:hypothetical protein PTT_12196 [Pyrenophora teres f. teres 0-1]